MDAVHLKNLRMRIQESTSVVKSAAFGRMEEIQQRIGKIFNRLDELRQVSDALTGVAENSTTTASQGKNRAPITQPQEQAGPDLQSVLGQSDKENYFYEQNRDTFQQSLLQQMQKLNVPGMQDNGRGSELLPLIQKFLQGKTVNRESLEEKGSLFDTKR